MVGRKGFPTADLGNIHKSILGRFPKATHAKGKGWPCPSCCMAMLVPAPPAQSGARERMHKENTPAWSWDKCIHLPLGVFSSLGRWFQKICVKTNSH